LELELGLRLGTDFFLDKGVSSVVNCTDNMENFHEGKGLTFDRYPYPEPQVVAMLNPSLNPTSTLNPYSKSQTAYRNPLPLNPVH